jgi:anti-sigma28 factor (negative regulator of flagellin synthesis)
MARIAALMELQPAERRKSQEARNDRGRDTSPDGAVSMEQILEDLSTTPQEEVLKKIASLPRTQQDKVLDIRRQLAEGTYKVPDRLDWAIDRVVEDCVFVFDTGC